MAVGSNLWGGGGVKKQVYCSFVNKFPRNPRGPEGGCMDDGGITKTLRVEGGGAMINTYGGVVRRPTPTLCSHKNTANYV
jgi:hypothetical protein